MAKGPRKGRKVRVDLRRNTQSRRRSDEWTRRFRAGEQGLLDERRDEAVRAKGGLSRRRTIVVDDDGAPLVDESKWLRGVVLSIQGLVCRVQLDDGAEWDCTIRRVLRSVLTERRSSVAVGDRVWFSEQSKAHDGALVGVIERVAERTAILSRRDRRKREHAIVANVEQLLIAASVCEPALKPHLIDRYLVAAVKGDLRPILCFNKWDLLESAAARDESAAASGGAADETTAPDDAVAEFEALGYCCLKTSATTGLGMERLREELRGSVTVLSGQSGVGKSTLLNWLQPGLGLATQAVSEDNQKGKHTTSIARLFRLDFGGYVVDTPGIRQFDLWNVEPGELEACFVEFVRHVPDCAFRDCHHTEEAGCAVRAAVEEGRISARRYGSYLKMLGELARG